MRERSPFFRVRKTIGTMGNKTGKQCRVVHTLHFCLLGHNPQSPLNSSVAGAGCAFLRNALMRARPAKFCIMEMCITDHSTDGKRHSQGMEKSRLYHTQQTAFTTAP